VSAVLQFTLTANAGFLLQLGGYRFLVDALHRESGYPFSPVPQELLDEMSRPDSPFHDADFVLFSHDHPDHYTPDVVVEYLRHNRVRRLLLPAEQYGDRTAGLMAFLATDHRSYWKLGLPRGKRHLYRLEEDVFLLAAGIRHVSEPFRKLNCDALLLSVHGENVLVLSDCDYMCLEDFAFLQGVPVRAAVVNPLLFHAEEGRQLLHAIDPEHVLIYHIPFEGEDTLSMRSLVRQDLRKHAGEYPDVQALMQCRQTITLL